jgi:hypothetical protein
LARVAGLLVVIVIWSGAGDREEEWDARQAVVVGLTDGRCRLFRRRGRPFALASKAGVPQCAHALPPPDRRQHAVLAGQVGSSATVFTPRA